MGVVLDEELAELVDIAPRKVARIRAAGRPNICIDESPQKDSPSLAETLSSPDEVLQAESLESEFLNQDLDQALNQLNDRERVRQIRNRAFTKIRDCYQGQVLIDYLG